MDSYLDFVDISFEGRSLQMRPSQLTTTNIARAFRLIPDTIILVSDRGTLALPTDGVFDDVDECYTWTVEGDTKQLMVAEASLRGLLNLVLNDGSLKLSSPVLALQPATVAEYRLVSMSMSMHKRLLDCQANYCPCPYNIILFLSLGKDRSPTPSMNSFIKIPILHLSMSCPKSGQVKDFVEGSVKIIEM